MKRIAIIGAGLSGLICGKNLQQAGHEVTIFEKSRGIGGRLATRRAEPFYFDHGVAAFTAHNGDFKKFIQSLAVKNVIEQWSVKPMHIDNQGRAAPMTDGAHYYVGTPAMNTMGKHLASALNVQRNTRVTAIIDHLAKSQTLELMADSGESLGQFDVVIFAMPVEQTKSLAHTLMDTSVLDQYRLMPCSVLMLGFHQPLPWSWDYATIDDANIATIVVNSAKPNRVGDCSVVIHSTAEWTNAHIDEEKSACIASLIQSASQRLGVDLSQAVHQDMHHWRYATGGLTTHQTGFLLNKAQQIGICGDWLLKGDVESAFLSGQQLSNAVIDWLQHA